MKVREAVAEVARRAEAVRGEVEWIAAALRAIAERCRSLDLREAGELARGLEGHCLEALKDVVCWARARLRELEELTEVEVEVA